jgi:hypothetical protein
MIDVEERTTRATMLRTLGTVELGASGISISVLMRSDNQSKTPQGWML